jgi:hypothetical protein
MLKISITLIVAAALLVGVAACGKTTLDQSSEVDLVNKQLQSDNLKAKSVDCPSDVEAKEGATLQCDVTLTNGNTGSYTITIEKVSGDSASLKITDAQNTTKK